MLKALRPISIFVLSLLLCVVALATPVLPVRAEKASASAGGQYVTARLIFDSKSIAPGKPFRAGVELLMVPGWHTYYKESGEAGMPTKIEWNLPAGFTASDLLWEKPNKFNDSGIITYGYHDRTLIAATITPPVTLPEGKPVTISAKVKWLSCKDICLPGGTDVSGALPVAAGTPEPDNAALFSQVGFKGDVKTLSSSAQPPPAINVLEQKLTVEGSAEHSQGFLVYVAFAFIGGFILNFMPCVLPVIAIKVLSLFEHAQQDAFKVRQLGLVFAAGIVSSFMVLAGIMIAIQAAGQKVGWGFQFQHPAFVIFMSVVVLLFALSLFGLFYVQVTVGQDKIDQLACKEGVTGTFFKGVLATVLSTPCTAPFLGSALGFAVSQPWWTILTIFFVIGLGMSLPYLLLTANPDWLKYMPKPGVWMEKFKESLGFVLLATVVWLLYVLGSQVGVEGVVWTGFFLVAVAFAAWIVSRFTDLTSTQTQKVKVWSVALFVVGLAYYYCIAIRPGLGAAMQGGEAASTKESSEGPIAWERFSPDALNKHLTDGKTVFLDFTAQWCLTCKVNEQTVILSRPVVQKLKALNAVTIKADWTRQDPQITQMLNKFNRSGVPLYVIFPGKDPTRPILLPEVITPELVVQKLDEAGPSK
jgi:thiol:disulfide interchange protein